jgi:Pilus formation protein N terminal region
MPRIRGALQVKNYCGWYYTNHELVAFVTKLVHSRREGAQAFRHFAVIVKRASPRQRPRRPDLQFIHQFAVKSGSSECGLFGCRTRVAYRSVSMTDVCVRGRAGLGLLDWLTATLFIAVVALPALAAEPIVVQLDRARLIKLPERAATIVIGNPLIADLSVQPGGIVVITGKGYGATNIIVLDRDGAVLTDKTVEVKGPSDPVVVVYRGVTRQTYSCTPECSRRITLGDTGQDYFDDKTTVDKDYFAKTLAQTTSRNDATTGVAVRSDSGNNQANNSRH